MAKAYWNREEASDFKDGWWHSGDLVKVDEGGFYYVVERKKDMILTGGMNVSARGEVEDVIAANPAVNLVSVIGVPDEKWGEAVKAIIVLKEGLQATVEEIINYCKERLAGCKKPKYFDFINIFEMPFIGGGCKVHKSGFRHHE